MVPPVPAPYAVVGLDCDGFVKAFGTDGAGSADVEAGLEVAIEVEPIEVETLRAGCMFEPLPVSTSHGR